MASVHGYQLDKSEDDGQANDTYEYLDITDTIHKVNEEICFKKNCSTCHLKHNLVNIKIKSKNTCFIEPAHEVHHYFLRAENCKSETV